MQLFGITIFALLLTKIIDNESKSYFSKERWMDFVNNDNRFYMLDSITKKIQEMTRNEVIELLGDPTNTDYFMTDDKHLVYVLGPQRGYFRIDYEWLTINFNKDGIVNDYSIATD